MEAGIDEVGRGCLAGPVISAAVILPEGFSHPLIKDSKKLSPKKREEAYQIILENAISYGIGSSDPEEIDRINILQATFVSMKKAIDNLNTTPSKLLVDGDKFPGHKGIPFEHPEAGLLRLQYPFNLLFPTFGAVKNAMVRVKRNLRLNRRSPQPKNRESGHFSYDIPQGNFYGGNSGIPAAVSHLRHPPLPISPISPAGSSGFGPRVRFDSPNKRTIVCTRIWRRFAEYR